MTTTTLPQSEGQYSPAEAAAWRDSIIDAPNLAGIDGDLDARSLGFCKSAIMEWSERLMPLHKRWRATYKMLSGNTIDRAPFEDVHIPEIYKAIETLVPRIEEAILEKDPWFRVVPRRSEFASVAATVAAYIDWQFDQAKMRTLIQPSIRNMLVTQVAAFHVRWEDRETMRTIRTVDRSFDKNGKLVRKVKSKRQKVIDYSGPAVSLVDPFDFIIDTKATCPQTALYVGHRAFLTVDEIKRIGKIEGWKNLDKIGSKSGPNTTFGLDQDYYKWARDPASQFGDPNNLYQKSPDGTPEKLEVVMLYTRWTPQEDGDDFEDYRHVVVGGRTVVEIRKNPHDGGLRPYATMRSTKSGHEFYGIGTFDNAIRLNQHLDQYHQIFLRGSKVAAIPFAFVEDEDGEFPDSLYKVQPGKVFQGVGAVRFSQVPDGFLRSAPLVLGTLQKNIEEVVGAFRIQMGQDSNGTATEATLSLQEGNRRTRGIIRAVGDGLEQLLELFYRLDQQFSCEDVEFPVLGKRGVDLRRTHVTINPADLLGDVKFDLVGLHSLRTYGLKATGLQAFTNAMMPLMVANPQAVNQVHLMHEFARELIGPDEADVLVRVPTPPEKLLAQELENEILVTGTAVPIDQDDDDMDHLDKMEVLFNRAIDENDPMPADVRRVVIEHNMHHRMQAQQKRARDKAMALKAPPQPAGGLPPEAGGTPSADGSGRQSPRAGGTSPAMELANEATPGGQTAGENPGPTDSRKYPRSGRAGRQTSQMDNGL